MHAEGGGESRPFGLVVVNDQDVHGGKITARVER
jgi:hypothetical protein